MLETIKEWLYVWIMKSRITAQRERDARTHGLLVDAEERAIATYRAKCNHHKGGWVKLTSTSQELADAILKGDATQYAVIKHQHVNGDIWVSCIRCGKKWKPPIRSDYRTDREYFRAVEEYEQAKEFPTNNRMSTSVQCRFELKGSLDAGHEYVRKQMANS